MSKISACGEVDPVRKVGDVDGTICKIDRNIEDFEGKVDSALGGVQGRITGASCDPKYPLVEALLTATPMATIASLP